MPARRGSDAQFPRGAKIGIPGELAAFMTAPSDCDAPSRNAESDGLLTKTARPVLEVTREAVSAQRDEPAASWTAIRRKLHRSPITAVPWLLPVVSFYGLFLLLPFALAVRYSLTRWDGVGSPTFIGLRNYETILSGGSLSGAFLWAVLHSLMFFGVVYVASLLVGVPVAYCLSQASPRLNRWLGTVYLVPLVIPPLVVGYMFLLLLEPGSGVAYDLGQNLHVEFLTYPLLGSAATALPTIAAIAAWMSMGLVITIIWAALMGIPSEILEAVRMDGANRLQEVWSVVVPLVRPALVTIAILEVIGSFATFDIIYVTEGITAGPSGSADVLATLFYSVAFGGTYGSSNQVGLATAIVVLGFAFALLMAALGVVIQRRWRVEW